MANAIVAEHISVWAGKTPLLNDVSLQLKRGSIVGLIGPSGAGKTTFIRCLVGRLRPHDGELSVFGLPAGDAKLRARIGYMTQAAASYSDLSVAENIRYFAAMAGVRRRDTTARVADVLELVDLAPQAHQMVRSLSGGQQQRVSLALALVGQPDLLVLDEPTVGLDPVLRKQLWKLFERLASRGTTIVLSSHVMDEASRCHDIVLIRDGHLLAHDAPAELCAKTKTKSVEAAFLVLVGGKK